MQKYLKFTAFIFLVSLILPSPVKAYLDPGSASFLFQILIAGALGALFYIKTILKWIKNLFRRKDEKE
jgi:hypothetical protein